MKVIDTFTAEMETGLEVTILEVQDSLLVGHLQDSSVHIAGTSRLVTVDGMTVNDLGSGTYQIVALGLKVRRTS
jgi:hypothetical protein